MTKSKVFETVDEFFHMLIANNMNMQQIIANGELISMVDFMGYLWNLDDKGLYKLSYKITRDSKIATINCTKLNN